MCADDISVERLVIPPVVIPIGIFWEELEAFWSDLVNELPNIPDGGNDFFASHLKPTLGDYSTSAILPQHMLSMFSMHVLTNHTSHAEA